MTLTQLYYMSAVAEYGNFTIAADKCFVTQPTLSMQVQKLEDELGVKIFNRATKPIVLTDIGKKINSTDQAKGQYTGLFKLTPAGIENIKETLSKYPGDESSLDMTALFQLMIKRFHNVSVRKTLVDVWAVFGKKGRPLLRGHLVAMHEPAKEYRRTAAPPCFAVNIDFSTCRHMAVQEVDPLINAF